jgi:exonuclease III
MYCKVLPRLAAYPLLITSLNSNKIDFQETLMELNGDKPDVVCLQEVSQPNISTIALDGSNKALLTPYERQIGRLPTAVFMNRRVGMYFFNEVIKIEEYKIEERVIRVRIRLPGRLFPNVEQSDRLTIITTYVPVDGRERSRFFEMDAIGLKKINKNHPHIVVGDLNDYEFPSLDRFPRTESRDWTRMHRFWEKLSPAMAEAELIDAFRLKYPRKLDYSRPHFVEGNLISATRIDHALVSESIFERIDSIRYKTASRSDHKMIQVTLDIMGTARSENEEIGLGPWKLHHGAFTESGFCLQTRTYAEHLLNSFADRRPFNMSDWIEFKGRLRSYTKAISIRTGHTRRRPHSVMSTLTKQIDALDIHDEADNSAAQSLYRKLHRARSLFIVDEKRAGGRLFSDGLILDVSVPKKHKKGTAKVKSLVSAKKMGGQNPPTEQPITERLFNVWEYYSTLFRNPQQDNRNAIVEMLTFLSPQSRITQETATKLAQPLETEELEKAIQECGKYSAPGIDGLPFEFWMNMKDIVATPFAEACSKIDSGNPAAEEQREWPQLLGTILHKKGPKEFLENYRLLSVLDTDLRWRAKALLIRMSEAVQSVISYQQTAFLPGRQLCDNVMALMLALEEARDVQQEAIILALDQEKAYDKVERTWLFRTMETMGFPEELITSIKCLYNTPVVRVSVNRFLTNTIKYMCGVLQGDPLSVLLYILTIQCFLDGLKSIGVGININWEGRSASLFAMAHADDLTAFVPSREAYQKLHELIKLYCCASNAVMHPNKTLAYAPGRSIHQMDIEWHEEIGERIADTKDDHSHLGCPFRLDGKPPIEFLEALIAKFKGLCVAWSLSGRPLIRRVEAANGFVLSGVWHATQLCPLPEDFAKDLQRAVVVPIFKSGNALIKFDKVCYPKALGGLGLLHPGYMMQAMNGRCVARMLAGTDEIAEAFKLSFLRALEQTDGCCFFKLFGPGCIRTSSIHMPPEASGFFSRVYDTMLGLKVALSEDWDNYTDEELMMIPFDYPNLIGKDVSASFGAKVRPYLFPLRIFLLRDILMFDVRRTPKFKFIPTERSSRLIQQRFKEFSPPGECPKFDRKSNKYHNATSGFAFLRKKWQEKIWPNMNQKFKDRLERINVLPDSMKKMQAGGCFEANSIYNLVLWHKLSLGKTLCKDYSVRQGRLVALEPALLMPSWEDIGVGDGMEDKEKGLVKLWTKAWKVLNWKHRPAKHHEPYWKLLHRRSRRTKGSKVDPKKNGKNKMSSGNSVDTRDEQEYHTGFCANCGQKDVEIHAYVECPEIQQIWQGAKEILEKLIGATSIVTTMNLQFSASEIVFCFPQLRISLPEILRDRVILWHSAVIYVITSCREWSLEHNTGAEHGTQFKYFQTSKRIHGEIRQVIWEIFEKEKTLGKEERFNRTWLNSSQFVWKEGKTIKFHG